MLLCYVLWSRGGSRHIAAKRFENRSLRLFTSFDMNIFSRRVVVLATDFFSPFYVAQFKLVQIHGCDCVVSMNHRNVPERYAFVIMCRGELSPCVSHCNGLESKHFSRKMFHASCKICTERDCRICLKRGKVSVQLIYLFLYVFNNRESSEEEV